MFIIYYCKIWGSFSTFFIFVIQHTFICVIGELSLVSDGGSSSTTSDANTPDSVDALDESTDSGLVIDASTEVEKPEVKEEAPK